MSHRNDHAGLHTAAETRPDAAACGSGCACHAGRSSGRARWALGAVILAVAAVLAARAVMKGNGTMASSREAVAASAFGSAPVETAAVAAESAAPALGTTAVSTDAVPVAPAVAVETIGTEIGAISDLNRLAADQTGVFVFVPSRDADGAASPKASMEAAARTISAQGNKIGLFTLKPSSADYEQVAMQVEVPGVIALVKDGGVEAVSGEITETKLVQAFVAASSAGGGCGAASGGCGTSGCK